MVSHPGSESSSVSVPVADSVTSGFPVAELTITETKPIWVYCKQGNHCQQGMVFAINPADQFAQFQAAATGAAPPAPPSPSSTSSGAVVTVTATVTVSGSPVTSTYTTAGTPAPTPGVTTDHRVIVGGPGLLTYQPSNITAQVGDTVTFEFRQKNHTVTMSSFAAPCRALALTSTTSQVGFDSGL